MLVPHLAGARHAGSHRCENGVVQVQWDLASTVAGEPAKRLHLLANFGAQSATQAAAPPGAAVYSSGAAAEATGLRLERGAVHATLEDVAGG
ncbi:DUF3459 domain-containing protein [Variovorax sp. S2]|uniref:DUF3459 domain-containing protein n=1 Tax=Variovorax sp. S12S4 TaxID=3029170 RepID=UPI00215C80C4|nr:DUF3459 domain-containing protein [Variovorax sp. S12S4]MCR8959992.1 DUF3459 domain-containing protein [Variovorax sp. S12S4]